MRPLILASAALLFVIAAPALAHGVTLVSATPAANGSASNVRTLSLTFSEAVAEKDAGVEIAMTGMPGMAQHKPMAVTGFKSALAADGKTLVLTLPRALPAGSYGIVWHVAAGDGHRSEGRYAFSAK